MEARDEASVALVDAVSSCGQHDWPQVDVPPKVLAIHVAQWQREAPIEPAKAALGEVYIASGCAGDVPGAVAAFEAAFFDPAARALRRLALDGDAVEETLQRTRWRLFVPRSIEACVPVLRYAGLGRLGGLVRVTMMREAHRLRTERIRTIPVDDEPTTTRAPEGDILREERRQLLATSLAHALQCLDVRSRNLLRLHYVGDVNASAIARMHGVHRATVGRWLTEIRQRLVRALRADLLRRAPELGGEAEIENLVVTQLDVSLVRLLGADPTAIEPGPRPGLPAPRHGPARYD